MGPLLDHDGVVAIKAGEPNRHRRRRVRPGLGAAVEVVEDLRVLPTLRGIAEGPVLPHAPAVPPAVAGQLHGGRGVRRGGGREGPASRDQAGGEDQQGKYGGGAGSGHGVLSPVRGIRVVERTSRVLDWPGFPDPSVVPEDL